ncbi:Thp1p Ecym_5273 [Eremothecium cymbalariae DBVPG|uniref:PCI domain-containing protein n=1 Tax=Eremothecium cymbalariae (strain CBS 270.75 / DBVPG 7215 / KCTC 17166 / NRRL Y-17582) TaxID=931890 RepID=I6ND94_ERECY|nr:hypothetical protein Ecym_5273 [Eremothecium cymbalariae DBVPG\
MNQFIQDLASNNVSLLNVNLEVNGTLVATLQKELQSDYLDDNEIERFVEESKLYEGKWTRFNILLQSFLKYCRDVNPWSLWESSDLIFTYYQDLSTCLLNDSYAMGNLVWLFRDVTGWIIPLATKLDANYEVIGTRENQFLQYVASVISKVFNSIKARFEEVPTRYDQLPEKQQILLFVANKLNNIYFQIDSPSSCSNIFRNMKPKSMIEHFYQYPIKEQIEYKYLLGRYYLLNHRVSDSFRQLNNSFSMLIFCSKHTSNPSPELKRNMIRVLSYLLPAGIILGKLPSLRLVEQLSPKLAGMYSELIHLLKAGNLAGLNQWLSMNEKYLLSKKLLLLLLEKLPVLAYRSLLRKVFQYIVLPMNTNRISYAVIEKALSISIADTPHNNNLRPIYRMIHTSNNAENVLVTLINHSLLRGNCFPLNKICVTLKTGKLIQIFPPINERISGKFPLTQDDAWLDS